MSSFVQPFRNRTHDRPAPDYWVTFGVSLIYRDFLKRNPFLSGNSEIVLSPPWAGTFPKPFVIGRQPRHGSGNLPASVAFLPVAVGL